MQREIGAAIIVTGAWAIIGVVGFELGFKWMGYLALPLLLLASIGVLLAAISPVIYVGIKLNEAYERYNKLDSESIRCAFGWHDWEKNWENNDVGERATGWKCSRCGTKNVVREDPLMG